MGNRVSNANAELDKVLRWLLKTGVLYLIIGAILTALPGLQAGNISLIEFVRSIGYAAAFAFFNALLVWLKAFMDAPQD